MIVALVNIMWQCPGKLYTFQGPNQLKNKENREEEEEGGKNNVLYLFVCIDDLTLFRKSAIVQSEITYCHGWLPFSV